MAKWLFQGNPDTFDIDGYLAAVKEITWTVKQRHLAQKMAVGDRVYLWRASGSENAVAGVVAEALIVEDPVMRPEHEEALPFWRVPVPEESALRVALRVLRVANEKQVIKREWLGDDAVLHNLRILRLRNETNYELSADEAARLDVLWAKTGTDWDRAECVAGLWLYTHLRDQPISKGPDSLVAQVAVQIGRAVQGVYNKVMNYRALDPADDRTGFPATGEETAQVWNEFYDASTQQLRIPELEREYQRLWPNTGGGQHGFAALPESRGGDGRTDRVGFPPLRDILVELNRLTPGHAVSRLQEIRKELKPRSHHGKFPLFDPDADWVSDDYALHFGGRRELQYNVGFEALHGEQSFRWGVAFSLESSRSIPDVVQSLLPKVGRFNDYVRAYPESLSGFKMWYWQNGQRSEDVRPQPVRPEWAKNRTFIVLGNYVAAPPIPYQKVFEDFDRLLDLYRFVESDEDAPEPREPALSANVT